MIWATVSSWSCSCWLYRASPSLAAKNIINLISVLTISWCSCVESSLLLLEEGVCYDQCIFLAKLYYLCPASFHIPRPNMPVTPGVSWLPTFAFQSPIMKRTSFGGGLVLKGLVGLHRTVQLQLHQHYWLCWTFLWQLFPEEISIWTSRQSKNHLYQCILESLVAQIINNLPAILETWVQSLGQEDSLEEEMATHSSFLVWRIPWTEEPGGL